MGTACILDKFSNGEHALSSIASSVSSIIDIMSEKFKISEELSSDSIGDYLELPALSPQYFMILHVNQVQSWVSGATYYQL